MANNPTIPFTIAGKRLDGVEMPAIKYGGATFSLNSVDGAGAGRNQNGDMMRDQVALKGKWELEFSPCTIAQVAALFDATKKPTFNVVAPFNSGVYYAGERSAPMLFYSREKRAWLCDGVSIHLIEV